VDSLNIYEVETQTVKSNVYAKNFIRRRLSGCPGLIFQVNSVQFTVGICITA